MSSPQKIYHLISFSEAYINAWGKRREKDEEYGKLIEGMNLDERRDFHKKYREENPHVIDMDCYIGKSYRGCFLDKQQVLDLIKHHAYSICEYYYTYLLVETRYIGILDDWCEEGNLDEQELWFKLEDGSEDFIYERCDKPKCFQSTVSFT